MTAHRGGGRVVVVEDDPSLSMIVRELLEHAGYEAVEVSTGAEALAFLLRSPEPCTVLLDLGMPDMDGWEVLTVLRAPTVPRHRVVIMSGRDRGAFPRGVAALRKPFTRDALLAAVAA